MSRRPTGAMATTTRSIELVDTDGNVPPGEGRDHRLGLKVDGDPLRRKDDRGQNGQSPEVEA